jgi:dephospho-CoA kinase
MTEAGPSGPPALIIGLTGGIGSGKSTVGRMLDGRDDVTVIEADAVVHGLQRKGEPVFDEIVERFGDGIVAADGELDREALGRIVFADDSARRDLEAIVHPAVGVEMVRLRSLAESKGEVVFLDIPLLAEGGPDAKERWGLDAVVVVYCPLETAIDRLVNQRGMNEGDARARAAAQLSPEDRRTAADFIVDNSMGLAELELEVDRLWHLLEILGERKLAPRTNPANAQEIAPE